MEKKRGILRDMWIVGLIFVLLSAGKLKSKITPDPGTKLLFIGSSSTIAANSYANIIADRYPGIDVDIIAQNGALTSWMVDESLPLIESGQYAGVFIFGGLNDIYATGKIYEAEANITEMVTMALYHKCVVTLITVQPSQLYANYTPAMGVLTDSLNNYITLFNNQAHVIDLYAMLVDKNRNPIPSYFVADGLHLTTATQEMLADTVINEVFTF